VVVSKRVYEPSAPADGYRVLIDRLWPRGIAKADARIDLWARDIAPSTELRKWYEHDPEKWPEFKKRYRAELRSEVAVAVLHDLARRARRGRVTLVYASHAADISNAPVLVTLINRLARKPADAEMTRSA
jgi:uncharacterized protein YeaO (DUF488 family)